MVNEIQFGFKIGINLPGSIESRETDEIHRHEKGVRKPVSKRETTNVEVTLFKNVAGWVKENINEWFNGMPEPFAHLFFLAGDFTKKLTDIGASLRGTRCPKLNFEGFNPIFWEFVCLYSTVRPDYCYPTIYAWVYSYKCYISSPSNSSINLALIG